jgi:hypothetical protein
MKNNFYIYGLFFIITLLLSIRVNYEKKKSYREELKLYWGKYCFHIHHWLTYTLFILLILIGRYNSDLMVYSTLAVLLAIILEDFLYGNVFILREKC